MRFSSHSPRTRPAMLTAARLADSLGGFRTGHHVEEPLVLEPRTHRWFGRTRVVWYHEHFSSIPAPCSEADQSQYDNRFCCSSCECSCNTECLSKCPNQKKVSQRRTGAHPATFTPSHVLMQYDQPNAAAFYDPTQQLCVPQQMQQLCVPHQMQQLQKGTSVYNQIPQVQPQNLYKARSIYAHPT